VARASFGRRAAGEQDRKFHVLLRGELVHEEVGLEDEADLVAPQVRQRALGELADAPPRD